MMTYEDVARRIAAQAMARAEQAARDRIRARIAELTAERDRLLGQYQAAIGELERLLPPAPPKA